MKSLIDIIESYFHRIWYKKHIASGKHEFIYYSDIKKCKDCHYVELL